MRSPSEKKTEPNQAAIEISGEAVGAPTPDAVEKRAQELAQIQGRAPGEVTEEDRLRASRELHDEMLGLSSDEARSDIVASRNPADMAVETGHEIKNVEPLDEQQIMEKEVKEGVREAEHERMLQGQNQKQETTP